MGVIVSYLRQIPKKVIIALGKVRLIVRIVQPFQAVTSLPYGPFLTLLAFLIAHIGAHAVVERI